MYGAKGAGKSELVRHSMINQQAVINITFTSTLSNKELISSVFKQITGTDSKHLMGINQFLKLIDKFIAEKKITPTFIFDVDLGSDITPGTYKVFRWVSKHLIHKCQCFIVIADPSAVLEFTGDQHRERFIYIDEIDRAEADTLLDKNGAPFTEADRKYIYDNVGTNPAMLVAMITDVNTRMMTMKSCVDLILSKADRDLANFSLQPILAALKKQPEGVPIDVFEGTICNGVNLYNEKEVGAIIRNEAANSPVIYRMEIGQFQLMSTAHKTALKSYTPPTNKTKASTKVSIES